MPFNICDNTMRCALWIMSIGQRHHCEVHDNDVKPCYERKQPKTEFINYKNFYGKFK